MEGRAGLQTELDRVELLQRFGLVRRALVLLSDPVKPVWTLTGNWNQKVVVRTELPAYLILVRTWTLFFFSLFSPPRVILLVLLSDGAQLFSVPTCWVSCES